MHNIHMYVFLTPHIFSVQVLVVNSLELEAKWWKPDVRLSVGNYIRKIFVDVRRNHQTVKSDSERRSSRSQANKSIEVRLFKRFLPMQARTNEFELVWSWMHSLHFGWWYTHFLHPVSNYNMASKLPSVLSATEEEIQLLLAAQCHIGTKNCDKQMQPYVWKRRADGVLILVIHFDGF